MLADTRSVVGVSLGIIELFLSFPTVVFTLPLALVMLYWLSVIVGAMDIEILDVGGDVDGLLDGAAEGAAEAAFEGAAEAAVEGATEAALEGAADAALEGAADAALDGAVDGADAASVGGLLGLLNMLGIRRIPITVILSSMVIWAWILSVTATLSVESVLAGASGGFGGLAIVCGAALAAIPFGSFSVRPLSGIFKTHKAPENRSFVAQECLISTGSVTHRFGQATVEDGGAGLLIQVRCDRENSLSKGDSALIVSFDRRREAFTVEPLSTSTAKQAAAQSEPQRLQKGIVTDA